MKITTTLPNTGYTAPNATQMASLLRIVLAAHPWLGAVDQHAFARAMWATGLLYRTRETRRDKYFHSWVEVGNQRLTEQDAEPVTGAEFMAAVIGHGDIVWQRQDARQGALLEIGVDEFRGLACQNSWRRILTGEANLLDPTPPRGSKPLPADEAPDVQIFQQDGSGRFRQLATAEPIAWQR